MIKPQFTAPGTLSQLRQLGLFRAAYDSVVTYLNQPPVHLALDIGCGICANSIRLARRGYFVTSADYSDYILTQARENVANKRLQDKI